MTFALAKQIQGNQMSKSPTSYVSRLDPQFRRFVNVVNVYPSSDTSASNDDLSKDGAVSLASSSCSELNKDQDIISVDAYTEENWPPSPSLGRQVSEFYLEYVNVLSSESEKSFQGNDNAIGSTTCIPRSPNFREDPRNTSSSEQRFNLDGIRNDCFEDDSVFWSDGDDERSHGNKIINQCLQERPGVSNKRQTLGDLPMGSFSSEADSEGSFRYRNEREGSLEQFGDTAQFFAGKDGQWNEGIISPASRRRAGDQEVTSGYPQGTSRQIADSFEDVSSLASESGYVPDVIEDGYSSTSSADSSFKCFALVGKQDDKRTKRKMASKVGRTERHKKHRQNYGDSSRTAEFEGQVSDRGLMACVVTGISGGPAIRVFRNEDSHSVTKSKSRSLYQREGALPYIERIDGDSTDHDALKGSQFHLKSAGRSEHDSLFALTAAPSISLVRDEQSSKLQGKRDTEGVLPHGVTGVDADKGVSLGYPGNYTPSKCYNDPEATKPEMRVANRPAGKCSNLPSKRGNSHGGEFNYELNSSINSSTELKNVDVMPNAPGNTASDYLRSSQDKVDGIPGRNLVRRSKENLQPDHLSKQIPRDHSPFYGSEEVKRISYSARQKQMPEDSMTRSIGHGNVQRKVVPIKMRSIKREVTSNSIRKSLSKGERLEGNLQDNEKQQVKDMMAIGDAEKTAQATDPSLPAREKNEPHKDLKRGPVEYLSDRAKKKNTIDGSLSLEPAGGGAFGSYKQQQGSQTTDKRELKAKRVREDTWLVKGELKEECTDREVQTGLVTSVRQALHKDNGGGVTEWKISSNEEDQACPEIQRARSFGTESESCLDLEEDRKATVDITEGLPTDSGDILLKGQKLEDDRKINVKENVDASVDKIQGVTIRENVDTNATSKLGGGSVESELEGINQPTRVLSDHGNQPLEQRCDDVHTVEDGMIDSQLLEIDNERPGKDVSQCPSSRSTQQRTYNPVTKRKHNENEKQGKNRTKKSKRPFETSPKHNELHSKLTDDLPSKATEPHSRRRSSGTAHESLAKSTGYLLQKSKPAVEGNEAKRHSTKKAEREPHHSLEDDSKYPSIEQILPCNDKDEDNGNGNSFDNDNPNFSLVPVFKEQEENGGNQEVIAKEKADIITTHEQINQSCQEDEVRRTMRKTKSEVDAHFQPTDGNSDVPHNMKDKSTENHLSETDIRRYRKNITKLSKSPSSEERTYTHVPRQSRISKRKKQASVLSKSASANVDHLQLADGTPDPTRAREPYSQRESSNKPGESLAKALESLDDVEPSNEAKEYKRDFVKEKEQRKGQPLNGDRTKTNVDSRSTDFTIQSEETVSLVLSPGIKVAESNTLTYNDTRSVNSLPEKIDERYVSRELPAASLKPHGHLDGDIHKKNETSIVETKETSSTLLQSDEGVKKEDLFLNEKEPKDSTMDSPICEHVTREDSKTDHVTQDELTNTHHTSLQKSVERNSGVSDNITSLVEESEVLLGETKLSSVREEGFVCEKAVEHSTQQLSATMALPGKETPVVEVVLDMSEKTREKENVDSSEDIAIIDVLLEEKVQPLALADNILRHHQGSDITSLVAVQDATKSHIVTEDVCFVGLDVNDNLSEDGALPTTEAMFSRYLGETADCLDGKPALANNITEPKFAEVEIQSAVTTFVEVNELDSNSDNGSSKMEVEEVICSYEGRDYLSPSTKSVDASEIRQTYSENNDLTFQGQSEVEISTQDNLQASTWVPLEKPKLDCSVDCLQHHLLQDGNRDEERNSQKGPVASAKIEKQRFGTFKADRFHSGVAVKVVADQQCQVAIIKGSGSPPECKTKESQTSFSYNSVNAASQTNEILEVSYSRKAFLQQNVECQTEMKTNAFASVGVHVKVPDHRSEDKIGERENALAEDCDKGEEAQARQTNNCQHIDKDCQTSLCYELVLASSKQCQVNDDIVMLDINESAHHMSFDSKECQTTGNNSLEFVDCGTSTTEVGSSRLVSLANKECQTSVDNVLVTSSTQCEILTVRGTKDESAIKAISISPLTSYDDKECQTVLDTEENENAVVETEIPCESKQCQTLLDTDFLLAALKEYQNSSYSYPSEETKKAGLEAGMFHESKECQTNFNSDLISATSTWTNTSGEITMVREEAEKSYESKGCQTFLDTDLSFATSKSSQISSWSNTPDEVEKERVETDIFLESKECQTSLDFDLLLATSKQCQTSWCNNPGGIAKLGEETEISYLSKECQTEIGLPAVTSKESQTMPEFAAVGSFKTPTETQAHQYKYVVYNNKECQTDPGLMNDHHLPALPGKLAKADSVARNNQTADSLERNKPTYGTKASQTATTVSSSKLCQTSNVESTVEYHSRESQTSPDGDMYLATSKECQTVAYTLEDLSFLSGQMQVSSDMELFNDAEAEGYGSTPCSSHMGPHHGASRPSTYGKSPDEPEVFCFESTSQDGVNDTEPCQTTAELASKPANFVFPPNVAEIGCQAVLCHCGHFIDELENENTCSSVPSDPQNGYLIYDFSILGAICINFSHNFSFVVL